jgi:hypothetical protein
MQPSLWRTDVSPVVALAGENSDMAANTLIPLRRRKERQMGISNLVKGEKL